MNSNNPRGKDSIYSHSQDGSQNQGSYRHEDGMSGNSDSKDDGYKSRRRSKKDNEGRNFKCDK